MENLILAIALYVVFMAIAYQPKTNCTTTEPINYFPEPEPEPELMAIAVPTETKPAKPAATVNTKPLEAMTIRELYQLAAAANAKVKGYKKLNKSQLIAALAA